MSPAYKKNSEKWMAQAIKRVEFLKKYIDDLTFECSRLAARKKDKFRRMKMQRTIQSMKAEHNSLLLHLQLMVIS